MTLCFLQLKICFAVIKTVFFKYHSNKNSFEKLIDNVIGNVIGNKVFPALSS
jgi:uncharacterized membrane protein YgaE (UPF0421/DUF939 family)